MGYHFQRIKPLFLRLLILLLLLVHFALTLVYVSPVNPLRDSLRPVLDATVGAYFPQDWNLFAPTPRTADLALLVRPLNADELNAVRKEGLPKDGWYDLSAPLWTQFQSNRFSAYNRLGRPEDQAIVHYLSQSPRPAVQLMIKIASAFCKDIGQNHATSVALVIYERFGRPWLARETSRQRTAKLILVGIYPIDKQVRKMNLYHIGGKNGYGP